MSKENVKLNIFAGILIMTLLCYMFPLVLLFQYVVFGVEFSEAIIHRSLFSMLLGSILYGIGVAIDKATD